MHEIGGKVSAYEVFSEGRRQLERLRHRREDNIKIDLK
jgi:hypothetical protein